MQDQPAIPAKACLRGCLLLDEGRGVQLVPMQRLGGGVSWEGGGGLAMRWGGGGGWPCAGGWGGLAMRLGGGGGGWPCAGGGGSL